VIDANPTRETTVEQIQATGPSVEEAVEVALARLGVSEQEIEVEVVQEPRSGFLGMGGQEAVVLVRLKRRGEEFTEEQLDEQADVAADFIEDLLTRMGMEASVETTLEDGTMYVDILGAGEDDDDMALLIGRHGQTLDALQELARHVVMRRTQMRCRVVVDVEDYKKRQRDRLVAKARDVAKRVVRTGREEELEPMTPFDRKVVHDTVARVEGVESFSRGEEPERRVVIRRR
jgi:spoIIIJ-associated protein